MKIEKVKIKDLKEYKLNSKKHPKEQVEGLAESIKRFGFTQPVVIDANNEIIIGHGRLSAAHSLGMKDVPCLRLENLSEAEVRTLRILDNRISETGWDIEILNEDLKTLDADFSEFNVNFDFLADELLKFNSEDEKESSQIEDSNQFIITIDCKNESEQQQLFEEFSERGLKCKLIM
jgi:ParB family transcriptional regulator, chromosome partitioning protein